MTQDWLISAVVGQVGEEAAQKVKDELLKLADKMSNEKIYFIKKIEGKGVCLFTTTENDCTIRFPEGKKPLSVIQIEDILRKVEI